MMKQSGESDLSSDLSRDLPLVTANLMKQKKLIELNCRFEGTFQFRSNEPFGE